jgi:hypothetical protein
LYLSAGGNQYCRKAYAVTVRSARLTGELRTTPAGFAAILQKVVHPGKMPGMRSSEEIKIQKTKFQVPNNNEKINTKSI